MPDSNTPMIIETGGGNNGGMFGMGESGGYIILFLLLLFGLFGGNFGNGFCGNRGGGGTDSITSVLPLVMNGFGGGHSCGTAIADGFALNNLQGGIHAIQQGLCDSTYAITSAINNCCCTTQSGIKDVRFDVANGLCSLNNNIQNLGRDILESQNNGTRAILDYLANSEAQRLRDEVQTLRLAASQSNQNAVLMAAMDANKAEILRRTGAECPTAAYLVNAPTPVNFPVNSCGQVQFGGNGYGNCGNGCGCGW